jgi:hypothetical protein
MTRSILSSVLLLALIGPLYVAIMGTCCSTNTNCKTCPDDGNFCTLGAYDTTLEATCSHPAWTDFRECTAGDGGPGWCDSGGCVSQQCVGTNAIPFEDNADPWDDYIQCNHVPTGGHGNCIDGRCVESDIDVCVVYGIGRINCCEPAGCTGAAGSRCTQPAPDGQPCDPTGVQPWGIAGQTGECLNGVCQSGWQAADSTWICNGLDNGSGGPGNPTYGTCNDAVDCTLDICDPEAPAANRCKNTMILGGAPCTSAAGTQRCCGLACGDCAPNCPSDLCNDNNTCTIDTCDGGKVYNGACIPGLECCQHTPKSPGSPCFMPTGGQGKCDNAGICVNFCNP